METTKPKSTKKMKNTPDTKVSPQVETEATPGVAAEPVQLSLNDLAAVVRLIDVVSKRGAFDGTELTAVGQIRDKFATFVSQNTPPAPEEQPPADAA
jgi:hypothetical protein